MKRAFALAALHTLLAAAHASAKPAPPALSSLSQADALYRRRIEPGQALRARDIYTSLAADPKANADLLWRAAMATYFVAHRLESSTGERERQYQRGLDFGKRGLDTAPDCAPCAFWTAVNLALVSEIRGPFRSLRSLKEVRALLARAAALDPAYAFGGAYRVLGIIETRLPQLIGGDRYKAREYFHAAITAAPDEPMNYLELARLEAERFHDPKTALAIAARGLAQPPPARERFESREARQRLAKVFASLTHRGGAP